MIKIKIRASALPGYNDCPRRAISRIAFDDIGEAGYGLRERSNGVAALIGTGVHASVERQVTNKIITGTHEGTLKDSLEIGVENFRDNLNTEIFWDATSPNKNDAERQIQTMAKSYYYQVMPELKPALCEKQLYATIADGITLSGKLDVLTAEGILHDTKTGAKSRSHYQQVGAYSLLAQSNKLPEQTGGKITGAGTDFLPRVPIKKPYPGAQWNDYDIRESEEAALTTIKHIIRDVRIFFKTKNPNHIIANTQSVLCSEKYCMAFGTDFCALTVKK